jgi:hypothetical protein
MGSAALAWTCHHLEAVSLHGTLSNHLCLSMNSVYKQGSNFMRKHGKLFAAVAALAFVITAHAIIFKVPPIPRPKITMVDAIKRAEEYLQHGDAVPGRIILAIDWSTADRFKPRVSDGSQFHVLEAKEEWSWYVTIVRPGSGSDQFGGVSVLRLRDDGNLAPLLSTRT